MKTMQRGSPSPSPYPLPQGEGGQVADHAAPHPQRVRLECLRLVMEFGAEADRREPVAKAQQLEEYVKIGAAPRP